MSSETAEQVMVSRLRMTEALDHGKVRQTFDVVNCPGLSVVCESQNIDGEFEQLSQVYHLASGATFDDADEALLAWDSQQTDLDVFDALGQALLRYRMGLIRPLWSERKAKDKVIWIAGARAFRRLLNGLGFDIVRMEGK